MSYCNECPNHDACDTGCVIGAARRIPTPSVGLIDTLDALYRETSPGEWETRFWTGGGSTIAYPGGYLVPKENGLSTADLCFIVEMRKNWPEIRDRLRAALSASSEKTTTEARAGLSQGAPISGSTPDASAHFVPFIDEHGNESRIDLSAPSAIGATQALIALGKYAAGYRPGQEGWAPEDQAALDAANGKPDWEKRYYDDVGPQP